MKHTLFFLLLTIPVFVLRQLIVVYPEALPLGTAFLIGMYLIIMFRTPQYARIATLALVPIITTIVEATFRFLSPEERIILMYAVLLSFSLSYIGIMQSFRSLFVIPKKFWSYPLAYAAGIVLGGIGFLVYRFESLPILPNYFFLFLIIPFTALTEELFFRKLVFTEISRVFSVGQAFAGTALLFGTLHVGSSLIPFVLAYGVSFVLTGLYIKEGNVWTSFFANAFMKVTFLCLLFSFGHSPLLSPIP